MIIMAEQESIPVEVMAELQSMDEQTFFGEEWATQVKQILYQNTEESGVQNNKQLFRVPKALVSGNPQSYVPQLISLGPYHHHHFKDEEQDEVMKMSTQEAYKVKSAAILSQRIAKYGESLDAIFEIIRKGLPEIGSFYQRRITGGNQYALMMMVDTLFLMYFIYSLFDRPDYVESGEVVKCDILKLENQIPLSVLKEVYENVKGILFPGGFDDYYYLLRRTCLELSPVYFYFQRGTEETEPHLLGFVHANVSRHLELQFLQPENPHSTLRQRISRFVDHYVVENICGVFFCFNRPTVPEPPIKKYTAGSKQAKYGIQYTAAELAKANQRDDARVRALAGIKYTTGELAKAGIKFNWTYSFWFDKFSRTLHIPQMTISSAQTTEVFFRNLLALELLDAARPKYVTQFIQLMDCLIDTPEDVHVLMTSGVISSQSTLSEEHIAKMWDSICQSCRGPEQSSVKKLKEELKEVLIEEKYYQTKIRIKIHGVKSFIMKSGHEYHQQYLSKPWNVVALLVGTVILAMNMVQAYCSVWECNLKSSK